MRPNIGGKKLAQGTTKERRGIKPDTPRKPRARTELANGSRIVAPGVDQRSYWVRRLRDVQELHLADLGPSPTEAEKSLVRRAATITVALEELDLRFARDGAASPKALDEYQRTAGNLRRILSTLGVHRRVKPEVTIDFSMLSREELEALDDIFNKMDGVAPTPRRRRAAVEPQLQRDTRRPKPDPLKAMTEPAPVSPREEAEPEEIDLNKAMEGIF